VLSLRTRDGFWIEVKHPASGDVLKIRVYRRSRDAGQLDLAFDDPARNFEIRGNNPRGASA
jgi:hypothetical protein